MLYALIWLAIGSNLLSKAEGGAYFGQGHISIILSAPFQAVKTGMDYMLATPYIQSVEWEGYASKFAVWLCSLLDYFYSGSALFLGVALYAGSLVMAVIGVEAYRKGKKEKVFLAIFTIGILLFTPVILAVQCKLPYFRVFSYLGIPFVLLFGAVLQEIMESAGKWLLLRLESFRRGNAGNRMLSVFRSGHGHTVLPVVFFTLLAIVLLLSVDYNREYGETEYNARDALAHAAVGERETVCVTDCYQQYLLKFCYDMECENMQIEGADLVLLHHEMETPEEENFRWEFYQSYETVPWDYIKGMEPIYQNKEYTVYVKCKTVNEKEKSQER